MTSGARSALAQGLMERSAECACLDRVLDDALEARGSLVLVEGEAGVGKSSLLHAAGGEAVWRGFAWLAARGRELERDVPFGIARELVSPLLRESGRPGTAGRRSRAEDVARLLAPSGQPPPAGADPRPPIIEALVALVEQLLTGDEERPPLPALVTVDDAHWADGSSLRFVGHLAERAEQRPLAVVVALRPDAPDVPRRDLDWLRARPGARILRPAPLTEAAVEQLVRERFPRSEPDFWRACAEVSGGNPFLLGELLSALAEDGIEGRDGDAQIARTLVPDAVLRSTLARLGRLSTEAASLAGAIAVLGEAPLRHAAALADLEPKLAEDAADALTRERILFPGEPLRFVHPLVASAVYSDLPPFSRARAHRRAAELLAAEGAPAEHVAGHLRATRPDGDPWVVDRLREAAASAVARGEPAAAVRFLTRALVEPPPGVARGDVLVEVARAEATTGEPAAITHLDEALKLLDDAPRRARAALELAGLLFARLDLPAAAKIARRGREDAADCPPVTDALLAMELTAAVLSPQRSAAVDHVAALRRDALAGHFPAAPELLALLAATSAALGDPAPVVRELARRAQAGLPADRAVAEIFVLLFVPLALMQCDEFAEAERLLERSIEGARREGKLLAAALASQWRAQLLWQEGRLHAAASDAEWALRACADGWGALTNQAAAALAHIRLDLGDDEAAREAIRVGEEASGPVVSVALLHARGRMALHDGDPAAALRDFEAAGEYLQRAYSVTNPAVLPWRSRAALAAQALGDRERAVALVEAELADARRVGLRRPLGVALAAAGVIAQPERSVELLREAVAVLEESPARLEHTRALVELGTALRRTGRRPEAREPLRRALEQAETAGAAPLARRARDELRACGARPRRSARSGPEALTATERRIAELAVEGRTNNQIATDLGVTTKTVEWHLNNVYRKLAVASRGELRRRLRPPGDGR